MRAFKNAFTPPIKRSQQKKNDQALKPILVNLLPGSEGSVVIFEDIPVTKKARRLLMITNPHNHHLKVLIEKLPESDLNFTFEWTVSKIPQNSQKQLEIEWRPLKVVERDEVIYLCDELGNKKRISLILRSCELLNVPTKKTTNSSIVAKSAFTTTNDRGLSSTSGKDPKASNFLQPTTSFSLVVSDSTMVSFPLNSISNLRDPNDPIQDLTFFPAFNSTEIHIPNLTAQPGSNNINPLLFESPIVEKENSLPSTPGNVVISCDNVLFSPVTENKTEYKGNWDRSSPLATPFLFAHDSASLVLPPSLKEPSMQSIVEPSEVHLSSEPSRHRVSDFISPMKEYSLNKMRSLAIPIQRWWRRKLTRKHHHKVRAATKIQRWYRSTRAMVLERNRFLRLKRTVLQIENRVLANKSMQKEREIYQKLRRSTIFIQRKFRLKLETRKTQQELRVTQANFYYQKLQTVHQLELQLELQEKHEAARSIQAAWVGFRERNKPGNERLKVILSRLKIASKNIEPGQTLGAKLKASVKFLKEGYKHWQQVYYKLAVTHLTNLEYMTRTVPWILIKDAMFVSSFCYEQMEFSTRSEEDKQLIELCSCIILNLNRFEGTRDKAFKENGLSTICRKMLLRWCNHDCGIFNTLCTLVWVVAQCPVKKQIIQNFMTMRGSNFILVEIKEKISQKENKRLNSRYVPQLQVPVYSPITPDRLQQYQKMPSVKPDYGVIKTNPYVFCSSFSAFDNVLKVLEITTVKMFRGRGLYTTDREN